MFPDVEKAMEMAVKAHDGQYDRGGDPYIMHVIRVWDGLGQVKELSEDIEKYQNVNIEIVAWLHDVVEDTDITLQQIHEQFGGKVGDAVDAITKRKGETLEGYYLRVMANPISRVVKLSDLYDNFRRNHKIEDEATRLRMAKKYSLGFDMLR